jgi:lysophospholipase L1-like esterase
MSTAMIALDLSVPVDVPESQVSLVYLCNYAESNSCDRFMHLQGIRTAKIVHGWVRVADSGDHLHPNPAGLETMASAVMAQLRTTKTHCRKVPRGFI